MTTSPPKNSSISVIVPARNEAGTIARVIETMSAMPLVDEVVVVDNGSTDGTAAVAKAAGGRVVTEARPGMGHAIRAGFIAARHDWVMKVDADLDRFDTSLFGRMIEARGPGVGLVKGLWQDPRDPMPMTRYLVMPALRQMFPALGELNAPNSGIYAFDRSLIALPEIVGDYAADIDVMLRVHAAGAEVIEVDIGRLDNNPRDGAHYSAMSDTIMGFFLRQRDLRITDEIVVQALSARQVLVGSLGLLAGHARSGGRVTLYLPESDDAAMEALRDAFRPFPTARIEAPEGLASFRPGPHTPRLRMISSHPSVSKTDPLRELLLLGDQVAADADLMVMACDANGRTVGPFEPTRSLPTSGGAEIKKAALARLGMSDTGPYEFFYAIT